MLSRALRLATVTLLIGCLTAGVARAAENLDAGKSPSQIFSSTCSACHKSPRGLLKNTPASSLPGFLRQHYTTGSDMASVLSAYLLSNGAADPRYQSKDQSRKDARRDGRRDARPDPRLDVRSEQPERLGRRQPPAQEASRPDAESGRPQGEGVRPGRDGKRYGRPRTETARPEDGQVPVQAATDSKSGLRPKQGKRGRPVAAEPPKTEQEAPAANQGDTSRDASRSETDAMHSARASPAEAAPDTARSEPSGNDTGIIKVDPPRESATIKIETPKEITGGEANPLRPDPVPSAVSAPPAPAAIAPDAPASSSAATPAAPSPPVTATAPGAPAGPPVPPISRSHLYCRARDRRHRLTGSGVSL